MTSDTSGEEARFQDIARAVRLFGRWASARIGLNKEAEDRYVMSLADLHATKKGTQHVIGKVRKDLGAKGISLSEAALDRQFKRHLDEVKKAEEKKGP